VAVLGKNLSALLLGSVWLATSVQLAHGTEGPTEYQVKAVFIYNFSHFIEWPARAFGTPDDPFDICILGNDPFGAHLDEAVKGEKLDQHPLSVRRIHDAADVNTCRLVYLGRTTEAEIHQILTRLDHRPILTVSEQEGSAEHGVMIQFTTENNRIRLRINIDSARSAGLTISSKLLRPAEIVPTAKE
jgi:hypothetical protein